MVALMEWRGLNIKEKFQLVGACLFLLTLPYHREVNQIFMGLFLFSCAWCINRECWRDNKKGILIFISVYLAALISTIYDPNPGNAFKELEIQLTLLLVPLLFGASYRRTLFKDKVIKLAFITGTCSALLYLLIYFIVHMRSLHLPVAGWLKEEYLNHHYSKPIDIHAGFFSCYVSLCFFMLVIYLTKARYWITKLLILSLILLCLVSLFLLTSRSVIILTFISLLCMLVSGMKRVKWYFSVSAGIAAVLLLYFFSTRSNYFEERFTDKLDQDVKFSELNKIFEFGERVPMDSLLRNDGSRIERWVAAVELIRKRPLQGYGTGEEKPQLYRQYRQMGLTVTLEQRYDSHNQFMAFAIKSGVLGLLSFIVMLAFAFVYAIRHRNYLYISFLLISTGISLIDNFLEVNKGIFFFSFFNIFLFIASRPVRKPTSAAKPVLKAV
ncbi:MAG TPA: O-antigen ligase family protein [Puia sp.]